MHGPQPSHRHLLAYPPRLKSAPFFLFLPNSSVSIKQQAEAATWVTEITYVRKTCRAWHAHKICYFIIFSSEAEQVTYTVPQRGNLMPRIQREFGIDRKILCCHRSNCGYYSVAVTVNERFWNWNDRIKRGWGRRGSWDQALGSYTREGKRRRFGIVKWKFDLPNCNCSRDNNEIDGKVRYLQRNVTKRSNNVEATKQGDGRSTPLHSTASHYVCLITKTYYLWFDNLTNCHRAWLIIQSISAVSFTIGMISNYSLVTRPRDFALQLKRKGRRLY